MDPQKQESLYIQLFQMWKMEATLDILTDSNENRRIFSEVQSLIESIQKKWQTTKIKLAQKAYKKLLGNLNYMFKDLMEIRAEKLLKYAQHLKKIDQTKLFPYEQNFYKQIYTAYKGLSKAKKLYTNNSESIINGEIDCIPNETDDDVIGAKGSSVSIPSEEQGSGTVQAGADEVPKETPSPAADTIPHEDVGVGGENLDEIPDTYAEGPPDEYFQQAQDEIEKEMDRLNENDVSIDAIISGDLEEDEDKFDDFSQGAQSSETSNMKGTHDRQKSQAFVPGSNKTHEKVSSKQINPSSSSQIEENEEELPYCDDESIERRIKDKNISYRIVRLLKSYPALVGEDMRIYGPFKSEDVVNMPEKNANILLEDHFAEKISLSR